VHVYTDFGLDRLRFVGLIPEKVQKVNTSLQKQLEVVVVASALDNM